MVPGAQLVGCGVGHVRLLHDAVRVPHPVRLVFGLLDDPHRRSVISGRRCAGGETRIFIAKLGFFDLVAALTLSGLLVGFAGRFWRPIRILLGGLAPLGSARIILFFLFEGSGSQCAVAGVSVHFWELSYYVVLLGNGVAVTGI